MKCFVAIAVLLLFGACVSMDDRPADRDLAGSYYRVKPGDTLSQIALKHKVSVAEIMEINGVSHERALRVGQALFLPEPDPIGRRIQELTAREAKPRKAVSPQKTKALAAKVNAIFSSPVPAGTVIHNFSRSKQSPYEGLGIKAPLGTPVLAAGDGRVLFVGDDGTKFGLLVILEHQAPFITVYTHLERATVVKDQSLKKGQALGAIGKSGGATLPHLHFQVRVNQKPQDPKLYLK